MGKIGKIVFSGHASQNREGKIHDDHWKMEVAGNGWYEKETARDRDPENLAKKKKNAGKGPKNPVRNTNTKEAWKPAKTVRCALCSMVPRGARKRSTWEGTRARMTFSLGSAQAYERGHGGESPTKRQNKDRGLQQESLTRMQAVRIASTTSVDGVPVLSGNFGCAKRDRQERNCADQRT